MPIARALNLSLITAVLSTTVNAQAISSISAKRILLVQATAPIIVLPSESESLWKKPFTYRDNRIPPPLLVIDGNVVPYTALPGVIPQQIEKIVVLKGEEAIKQFGAGGINGIMLLTMKKQ